MRTFESDWYVSLSLSCILGHQYEESWSWSHNRIQWYTSYHASIELNWLNAPVLGSAKKALPIESQLLIKYSRSTVMWRDLKRRGQTTLTMRRCEVWTEHREIVRVEMWMQCRTVKLFLSGKASRNLFWRLIVFYRYPRLYGMGSYWCRCTSACVPLTRVASEK